MIFLTCSLAYSIVIIQYIIYIYHTKYVSINYVINKVNSRLLVVKFWGSKVASGFSTAQGGQCPKGQLYFISIYERLHAFL